MSKSGINQNLKDDKIKSVLNLELLPSSPKTNLNSSRNLTYFEYPDNNLLIVDT